MRTTGQIRSELPAALDEGEREVLVALALRLEATAPAPSREFAVGLRRQLIRGRLKRLRQPPSRRALAGGYALAGALLLAVAAVGLAGIGPFGAG